MATARKLIVTGASGKQGGALISALLSKSSQPFEIYALTRNKTSRSAQALASKPNVHLIEGDFDNAEAIFKQVDKPWGLFLMSMPFKGAKLEEEQGKAMTKAAVDAGIKHIVFTATDRGGQVKSESDPTPIPHFISKYNIEKDIVEKAKNSKQGTTWTFLRPVCFLDNFDNGLFGKSFLAMWRANGLDNKVQMIGTPDIGRVAAEVFLHADDTEYRNQAVSLASDEFSPDEAAKIFKEVTGNEIPATYTFVGRIMRWLFRDMVGLMFDWFKDSGFKADVPALRQKYPFLKDFRSWLETESAWKKS